MVMDASVPSHSGVSMIPVLATPKTAERATEARPQVS
jgi:hypothetical protein